MGRANGSRENQQLKVQMQKETEKLSPLLYIKTMKTIGIIILSLIISNVHSQFLKLDYQKVGDVNYHNSNNTRPLI